MTNVFYFNKINKIGGTEQHLYEMAKKYNQYDITILYDEADGGQLARLRKYVPCKKYVKGIKIKCEKMFFAFNISPIDDIEAREYIFVGHAIYQEIKQVPPILDPRITKFICVSQYACDKLEEMAKNLGRIIHAEKCYNPLTLEPKEKVVRLVSAGRLNDKVRGGDRTIKLIEALDKYCEKTGRHYIWTIFTNPSIYLNISSPNVAIMKPRVDVRPYIADADWCVNIPNDMETFGYTLNEALGYGVPLVTTPLSVLKELPITDNEMIVLNWDCSNVDNVAKEIFEKEIKPFKYTPPKDEWYKHIKKVKSKYIYNPNEKVKVVCIREYYDQELNGELIKKDTEKIMQRDRADYLISRGLVAEI